LFESIAIGHAALTDGAIVGTLAECLLFYGRVHVIVDSGTFTTLARVCGPDTLLGFVEDGNLAVTYLENRTAVARRGNEERFGLVTFQAKGLDSQTYIPRMFQELTGKSGKGRRLASRLLARISTTQYHSSELTGVIDELIDPLYTDRVIPELLSAIVPGYIPPANLVFRVHRESEFFIVETNLHLDNVNAEYQRTHPQGKLTSDLLVTYLYGGSADLAFAANKASELACVKIESVIAEARLNAALAKSTYSANARSAFQKIVVPRARSVAEAVNDGYRSLEDVRRLLPKAAQFKTWLASQPDDADLIQEYVQQTTSLEWTSKLPTKSLRFILFNAAQVGLGAAIAGLPGAVAGVAIAAADSFLLDKLTVGWKPHQFIRGPFADFLGSQT